MKDLTEGRVQAHVLRFALFMFATMLFQTLYFLVDLYFVSQVGSEAVAAVSIAGNLMYIVMAATQALMIGTTTLISHRIGAKDAPGAEHAFNQSQQLALVSGLVFGVIAFLLREHYAELFAADAETARLAVEFLNWFIPALGLQFALTAMAAALRGAGDVKQASIVQVLTVALNIALSPVLVAGWGTGKPLGAAGAGLATFLSVLVGAGLLLRIFLAHDTHLRLRWREWRPDFVLWKRLLGIGLPAGGEFALMALYLAVVYAILSDVGMEAQAGFGVGMRVMQSIFLPALAVSFAIAPIAGQNFGAGRHDRVRETFRWGLLYVSGLMVVFTALCHIAPGAMIAPFSRNAEVVAIAEDYLRIVSYNFVAMGIVFSCGAMFQALGDTRPTLFASSLRIALFALPATWLAGRSGFAVHHLWYLSVASVTLQMVVVAWLLRRKFGQVLTATNDAQPAAVRT